MLHCLTASSYWAACPEVAKLLVMPKYLIEKCNSTLDLLLRSKRLALWVGHTVARARFELASGKPLFADRWDRKQLDKWNQSCSPAIGVQKTGLNGFLTRFSAVNGIFSPPLLGSRSRIECDEHLAMALGSFSMTWTTKTKVKLSTATTKAFCKTSIKLSFVYSDKPSRPSRPYAFPKRKECHL